MLHSDGEVDNEGYCKVDKSLEHKRTQFPSPKQLLSRCGLFLAIVNALFVRLFISYLYKFCHCFFLNGNPWSKKRSVQTEALGTLQSSIQRQTQCWPGENAITALLRQGWQATHW